MGFEGANQAFRFAHESPSIDCGILPPVALAAFTQVNGRKASAKTRVFVRQLRIDDVPVQ